MLDVFKKETNEYNYIYIDQDVTEKRVEKETPENIHLKIDQFMRQKAVKPVCLVLGNSGCGKSLFTKKLAYRLLETKDEYFPVYINLAKCKKFKNDLLETGLRNYGIKIENKIFANRKILFMLDGYESLNTTLNIINSNELFTKFPQAKVLITCKTHEALSLGEYKNSFSHSLELNIQPFTKPQIHQYIEKVRMTQNIGWNSADEAMHDLENIPGLFDLLQNAFLINLCIRKPTMLAKLKQERGNTIKRSDMYSGLLEEWIQTAIEKKKDDVNANSNLSSNALKEKFWKANRDFALDYIENQSIEFERTEENINSEKYKLRDGCPIQLIDEIDNKQIYAFIHPAMADYIVARSICTDVKNLNTIDKVKTSYFNIMNLKNKDNMIKFIKDLITKDQMEQLYNIIILSKTSSDVALAACNAISLLSKAGFSFKDRNFSGVRISGADLTETVFYNTNFEGADLSSCTFTNSNFIYTNFKNCNMENIELRQSPPLKLKGSVLSVAFSPDEKYLAAGGRDKKIYIWKTDDLEVYKEFKIPGNAVREISFSYDGKLLFVSLGLGEKVITYDIEHGKDPAGTYDKSDSCSVSKCGKYFALSSNQGSQIYDNNYKMVIHEFEASSLLKFSRNSRYLAFITRHSQPGILNIDNHQKFHYSAGDVLSVSLSNDEKSILTVGVNGNLKIFDIESRQEPHNLEKLGFVTKAEFSHDGNYIIFGGRQGSIKGYDIQNKEIIKEISVFNGSVSAIYISESGKFALCGSENTEIKIVNFDFQDLIYENTGHTSSISKIVFSPNGKLIASADTEFNIKI